MAREFIAGLPAREYHRRHREKMALDPAWRERKNEHQRRYMERNPRINNLADRKRYLWKKYGMTIEEREAMVAAQDGLCAACGNEPDYRGLRIDHNHETGVIREMLCDACNVTLGNMKDSPSRLRALAIYLEKHGH